MTDDYLENKIGKCVEQIKNYSKSLNSENLTDLNEKLWELEREISSLKKLLEDKVAEDEFKE